MKKRLVLKNWVKETLFILGCLVFVVACIKLLQFQDNQEYKKAISRCNGVENVMTKYTKQGDKYFSCKK